MWGVALCLFAAFVAGLLDGGGPTLWLAIVVGLAVFGGDPGDPVSAAVATVLAFVGAEFIRALLSARLRH